MGHLEIGLFLTGLADVTIHSFGCLLDIPSSKFGRLFAVLSNVYFDAELK